MGDTTGADHAHMATRHRASRASALAIAVVAAFATTGACSLERPARGPTAGTTDVLPSWADTPTRQAIVDFVARVTTEGSPDFVPPGERLATFDNDGTLWVEHPVYTEVVFAIDRVAQLAAAHPAWRTTPPFADILAGHPERALAGGKQGILEIIMATHAGMTPDQFERDVDRWLATARHPRWDRPYTDLVYQPMLELLTYLRRHGFDVYIVSGGETDFMRAWTRRAYDVAPAHVIGTTAVLRFELQGGVPVLIREPKLLHVDDGPGKPEAIERIIGARPILAFGNSDGDLEMLQWTAGGRGARFMGLVHHTDAAREYAYDRDTEVGRLDQALDAAAAADWTVVDMKRDWATIFAFERPRER